MLHAYAGDGICAQCGTRGQHLYNHVDAGAVCYPCYQAAGRAISGRLCARPECGRHLPAAASKSRRFCGAPECERAQAAAWARDSYRRKKACLREDRQAEGGDDDRVFS